MAGVMESGWPLSAAKMWVAMSQFPDPEQPSPKFPSQQPYPGSAPAQFDPRASTLPRQDQPPVNMPPWPEPGQSNLPRWPDQPPPPPAAGCPQPPPVAAGYGFGETGGQAVQAGLYLDQHSGLMLPQGTQLASFGRRIGAFFLTIALAVVTLFVGYIILGLLVLGNGQTPALQVLGSVATGQRIIGSRAFGGWRWARWPGASSTGS